MKQVTAREAFEGFKVYLRAEKLAASTQRAYCKKVLTFIETFETMQADERRVTAAACINASHVDAFLASTISAYTSNDGLCALRKYMDYCRRMKYIKPADAEAAILGRRNARTTRRLKHYIDAGEFPVMLDLAGERHPYDRAVLAITLYTACRVSELTCIRLSDADLLASKLRIYRQKRDRWTLTAIGRELQEEAGLWLAWYATDQGFSSPRALMDAHPDWYLIPRFTHHARGTDPKTGQFCTLPEPIAKLRPDQRARDLSGVIKPALESIGVDTGEHGRWARNLYEGMHTLRRSAARAFYEHLLTSGHHPDDAILTVAALLDHDDIKQTLRYIGMHVQRKKLDNYLLSGGSMFGAPARRAPRGGAAVVPLRGPVKTAGVLSAPAPGNGAGTSGNRLQAI